MKQQKHLLGDVVGTFPYSRCREADDPFAQRLQYLVSCHLCKICVYYIANIPILLPQ